MDHFGTSARLSKALFGSAPWRISLVEWSAKWLLDSGLEKLA